MTRGKLLGAGLLLVIALGYPLSAEAQPQLSLSRTSRARPVRDLPKRIASVPGATTLFADYNSASGGQIQLYLVNRTKKALKLPAQDGVLNIKLEAATPKHGWARAQRHIYSSCGNSYHGITIKAGHFVRIPHWFPTRGTKTQIRYHLTGAANVVSNIGAGRYLPDEEEHARLDALAMGSANAAQIREVLLTNKAQNKNKPAKATPASRWERQSTRDAAIRRIAKLPKKVAIPLAEQVVMSPWLDNNEFTRAVGVLFKVSPDHLADYVLYMLADAPSRARRRVVHELPFMRRMQNKALVADLLKRARDPRSKDVPFILDYLAGYRTKDVEKLLLDVQADPLYPAETRILARYDHEQWFGRRVVDLRIRPRGNYSDGHKRPVFMDITIINRSAAPISFAYSDPTEILSLYLSRAHGREKTFIPPRAGVRWFKKTAAKPKISVTLAPGQSHSLAMPVERYFDLGRAGSRLSVWVSSKLPGIHQVARLGGSGSGINPK